MKLCIAKYVKPGGKCFNLLFCLKNRLKYKKQRLVDNLTGVNHITSETVAAYVDGELPWKSQLVVTKHLVTCDACTQAVQAQKRIRGIIGETCKHVQLPDNLINNLNKICEHKPPQN